MLHWTGQRIEEMKQNDGEAQSCCYQEFSSIIYTAIFKIVRNESIAADLLQDTFIDAFEKIHQFSNKSPFIAWLKRIAFNNTLNHIKREKIALASIDVLQQSVSSETLLDESLCQADLLEHLLSRINENERLILWLFIVEQYSHEEISQLVGKSASYSKSIVSRSLKKIQQNAEVKAHAY